MGRKIQNMLISGFCSTFIFQIPCEKYYEAVCKTVLGGNKVKCQFLFNYYKIRVLKSPIKTLLTRVKRECTSEYRLMINMTWSSTIWEELSTQGIRQKPKKRMRWESKRVNSKWLIVFLSREKGRFAYDVVTGSPWRTIYIRKILGSGNNVAKPQCQKILGLLKSWWPECTVYGSMQGWKKSKLWGWKLKTLEAIYISYMDSDHLYYFIVFENPPS